MKTAVEVNADPASATPTELVCATVDNMAIAIRIAVNAGNRRALHAALSAAASAIATLQRWLDESEN